MTAAIEGLKIGVGTKIGEVYGDKQAFEQARLADKNGDHVIDEDELNRFVGPVLTVNEADYYPGLTLNKVKTGTGLKTFADIDIDGNKSLSAEEIVLYPEKQKVEYLKNRKCEAQKLNKANKKIAKFAPLGIPLAGVAGAMLAGACEAFKGFYANMSGACAWGAGFGIALYGVLELAHLYSVYKDSKNTIIECNKQLEELGPQVEKETAQILGKAKEVKETATVK